MILFNKESLPVGLLLPKVALLSVQLVSTVAFKEGAVRTDLLIGELVEILARHAIQELVLGVAQVQGTDSNKSKRWQELRSMSARDRLQYLWPQSHYKCQRNHPCQAEGCQAQALAVEVILILLLVVHEYAAVGLNQVFGHLSSRHFLQSWH